MALLLLLAFLYGTAGGEERVFTGYTVKESAVTELSHGVTYAQYRLLPPDRNSRRGQRIFVLDVASEAAARLTAIPDKKAHRGLENVKTLLEDSRKQTDSVILAGVNADFFDMTAGGSLGYLKCGGEWLSAGEFYDGWAVGCTEDGRLVIGQPHVVMTLTMPDGSVLSIDALNALRADVPKSDTSPDNAKAARKDNELVLYTPAFGTKTAAQRGGTEITVRSEGILAGGEEVTGVVTLAVKYNQKGGASLGPELMVLSAVGDKAEQLKTLTTGDTVRISLTAEPPFDQTVNVAGGGRTDGGPLLIHEGQPTDLEAARSLCDDVSYFYRRHPRTVAALREDGSWFLLAVEGNRNGSYGVTLEETQTLLMDLGAYTALNLDGGPSTTMVIRQNGKLKAVTDCTGGHGRLIKVGSALAIEIASETAR